jgi:hypothetical protein
MEESEDKKLREHIKAVFDNYDDGMADLGWQKLRKKHPGNRNTILWLTGVAAMLVAGIILYQTTKTSDDLKGPVQTVKKPDVPVSVGSSGVDSSKIKKAVPYISSAARTETSEETKKLRKVDGNDIQKSSSQLPDDKIIITKSQQGSSPKTVRESVNPSESIIPKSDVMPHIVQKESAVDLTARKPPKEPETINTQVEPATPAKAPILAAQAYGSVPEKEKNIQTIAPGSEKKKEIHPGKVRFGFAAGAFYNYADGSKSIINPGAGLTTDISLNRKLTLVMGLSFSSNELQFGNTLPVNSSNALQSTLSQSAAYNNAYNGVPPSVSKLDARLFNLDIPVNLKYSISRKSNKVFASAGLSSTTYLSENYKFTYVPALPLSLAVPFSEDISYPVFNKFDFARVLNLSMGFTISSGVQNIIVEPFVKRPLGGLGSQKIHFGSAGVSLTMNFNVRNMKSDPNARK